MIAFVSARGWLTGQPSTFGFSPVVWRGVFSAVMVLSASCVARVYSVRFSLGSFWVDGTGVDLRGQVVILFTKSLPTG